MAGRKKKLTQKLADQILELIADGFTIRETFEKIQTLHGNLLELI
jgi:hypothetical protein